MFSSLTCAGINLRLAANPGVPHLPICVHLRLNARPWIENLLAGLRHRRISPKFAA
jgi:hypothetical protein